MFGELSKANLVLLQNATKERSGHFHELITCLVFAAFKHEAFINHLGFKLISEWNAIERSPHRDKLEKLSTHLGVAIDKERRPFQTLHDLFEARDASAHGKPDHLTHENVVESGTPEELRRKKPMTEWESLCTVEFAKRAYDDTEQIAELLWGAAALDRSELRSRGHGYSISTNPGN
jgi:hypothetical protein